MPVIAAARRLVFFGAPGVGKGTFAARIAPILAVPTISTGDIMRQEIKDKSEIGQKVQAYTDKGALVPDELVTEMIERRIQEQDAQNGYILDGFPRTVPQAKSLDEFAKIDQVVNIELDEAALKQKLLGRRVCADCGRSYNVASIQDGELDMPPLLPQESDCNVCKGKPNLIQREDDTETVVNDRLRVYKEQTEPILEHYRKKGILLDFRVKKGLGDMDRLLSDMGISATAEEAEEALRKST
eukprot:gb/GECG01003619.1/.p1 GENE.gb/GECG01003619.1/~~gb/GECG01003619.1/.p1  ORF type:complete len:242 (+),score=50.23 gb/GECG01003619.1/:1-726(+)